MTQNSNTRITVAGLPLTSAQYPRRSRRKTLMQEFYKITYVGCISGSDDASPADVPAAGAEGYQTGSI
jgi:hypothetical protein